MFCGDLSSGTQNSTDLGCTVDLKNGLFGQLNNVSFCFQNGDGYVDTRQKMDRIVNGVKQAIAHAS